MHNPVEVMYIEQDCINVITNIRTDTNHAHSQPLDPDDTALVHDGTVLGNDGLAFDLTS